MGRKKDLSEDEKREILQCLATGMKTIDSFQSCDRLEDLEGKTSIELLHKCVNFMMSL